ncbi:hypothetical protein [Phascolarctobacterium sp.]|uniref:hypothetical protein n=1 Tax=Phascolarctobacterium sp. TaxID=2049039 RepID=UPI00205E2A8A|nr:MAG TPA: immunity protein [Caudoviricetes sp.]DAW68962.1 MAG TPA: immunity protein [Caudoviricetes sp.]
MTVKDLEKILITEKVRVGDYSFRDDQPIIYDGYLIRSTLKGKWELYYMERGQKDLLGTYPTDHACCIEFLRYMSRSYSQLEKYLPEYKTA